MNPQDPKTYNRGFARGYDEALQDILDLLPDTATSHDVQSIIAMIQADNIEIPPPLPPSVGVPEKWRP